MKIAKTHNKNETSDSDDDYVEIRKQKRKVAKVIQKKAYYNDHEVRHT